MGTEVSSYSTFEHTCDKCKKYVVFSSKDGTQRYPLNWGSVSCYDTMIEVQEYMKTFYLCNECYSVIKNILERNT